MDKLNVCDSGDKKIFLITFFVLFLFYFIYGVFFTELPCIKSDANWEVARALYLQKHHVLDDPILNRDVSPFLSLSFNATPLHHYMGIIKYGAIALTYSLLPVNENQALGLTTFIWSLLVCFFTYLMARSLRLSHLYSVLAVTLLFIVPEFFLQIHRERAEIALTACYIGFLVFFLKSINMNKGFKKNISLGSIGLLSWIPSIGIHPNGIFIPATLATIFLTINRRKIFTTDTSLFAFSFLPGLILFGYLMFSTSALAETLGGGNYLHAQGPPIFSKSIFHFLKLPILFYGKLATFNFFSRPISLFIFLIALSGFYILGKRKAAVTQFFPILIPSVLMPLLISYFFSGSYGLFNIFVFPVSAITVAFLLANILEKKQSNKAIFTSFISLSLILIFSSNFIGMKEQSKYAANLDKLVIEVKQCIPDDATVLGNLLFYVPFKNQKFYYTQWFEPLAGIPSQSFEDGVKILGVKYLIVDDNFIGSIVRVNRDSTWKNNAYEFIKNNCILINKFKTVFPVKERVPDPNFFPVDWRYPGMKKDFMQKVYIYKLKDV